MIFSNEGYNCLLVRKWSMKWKLTLQSKANLRASIIAAFLSLSDSNASTKESPVFGCQNDAWAAALPPPLTPHNFGRWKWKNGVQQKITLLSYLILNKITKQNKVFPPFYNINNNNLTPDHKDKLLLFMYCVYSKNSKVFLTKISTNIYQVSVSGQYKTVMILRLVFLNLV